MRTQQRHHLPQYAMVETLVLVVLACSATGSPMARATTNQSRVRCGDAGNADTGRDVPRNHSGHTNGASQLAEAVSQPAIGEELHPLPLPARHGEGDGGVFHRRSARRPLLPRSPDGAPASWLAALPARSSRALFHCDQRLPASASSGPHTAAGHSWLPVCDGISLVFRWHHQSSGFVRLCLLLCSISVGITDENCDLVAESSGTGGRLP